MTIAMCYVLQEGVIIGADSTASTQESGFHYYNHNQKLFEVGENSTLGIVTWGLGSLSKQSHRSLFADLGESLRRKPVKSVREAIDRWIDLYHAEYAADDLVKLINHLEIKSDYNVLAAPSAVMRTKQEEDVYRALKNTLVAGFCLGGRVAGTRKPEAFEVVFQPIGPKPVPVEVPLGKYRFWGVPNMAERLTKGTDSNIRMAILNSPHWKGTSADLEDLLSKHELVHPILPMRDAIDFVHMCIHSTIKALKFSAYNQICGGPIEIAAITTDRPFRWVRHKKWDTAMLEGELS